jgi:hypothetical protein
MGHMIVTGTADGLYEIGLDGEVGRHVLAGTEVQAVSGDWAIADDTVVSLATEQKVPLPDGVVPRCLLAGGEGACLVGTSAARLFKIGNGGVQVIESFDAIPDRHEWYTPWGGPPDTRSLAMGPNGLLVNVHVGGVWRTNGTGWVEAVAADQDVHQVVAVDATIAAAAAQGVGQSVDGGKSWTWNSDGLHATYCRAATVAEGWLLVSASTGPGTNRGGVYRRPLDRPDTPFAPCGTDGSLPRVFPYNVDTFELIADGPLVALGTPTGELYLSEDSGGSWRLLADALPGVRTVTFA